ncbi:protein arginine n-methyltransferase [Lasius niger]|uniref:Protein arginine n-methyltransferase n=1 Tax=Lasius niger TaxID=67767 RepID=A0A0J7K0F9_LASNI|nr:protein arginine n-methyltransferase [Lasius niger]
MAYKNAIFNMKEEFQGKVVMDVGAGSGILSIFCAHVGAKKVYAVEASMLAKTIEQVLIKNNLQDTIEVIHSKVEDIHPYSLEKIDIIVSEWMGFYLMYWKRVQKNPINGARSATFKSRSSFGEWDIACLVGFKLHLCRGSKSIRWREICIDMREGWKLSRDMHLVCGQIPRWFRTIYSTS